MAAATWSRGRERCSRARAGGLTYGFAAGRYDLLCDVVGGGSLQGETVSHLAEDAQRIHRHGELVVTRPLTRPSATLSLRGEGNDNVT